MVTGTRNTWVTKPSGHNILVEGEMTWFEARTFAQRFYGDTDVESTAHADAGVFIRIRMVGSDFGKKNRRRMQYRYPGQAWKDL